MLEEFAGRGAKISYEFASYLALVGQSPMNINRLLNEGVERLFRIGDIYEHGTPDQKKSVIGSMYPENLMFDGFKVRTARVNEVARVLYTLGEGLGENETGQREGNSALSCMVTPSGFKPETY